MNDIFTVILWPEIQDLMDMNGFDENSCLINDDPLLSEYGSSAYFVRTSWLEQIDLQTNILKPNNHYDCASANPALYKSH